MFGPDTELGRRRTSFGSAAERDIEDINLAMVEREPVTVVLSEKGWIRAPAWSHCRQYKPSISRMATS